MTTAVNTTRTIRLHSATVARLLVEADQPQAQVDDLSPIALEELLNERIAGSRFVAEVRSHYGDHDRDTRLLADLAEALRR